MNEYCIKYGLNEEHLPRHVAIIMDGNGRWAKKRLWNRLKGHRAGADAVDAVTTLCREIGVKYLTLYSFSTENWNRPESEVSGLMDLFREFLISKKGLLIEKQIRLNIIGEKDRFAPELLKLMNETIAETEKYEPVFDDGGDPIMEDVYDDIEYTEEELEEHPEVVARINVIKQLMDSLEKLL